MKTMILLSIIFLGSILLLCTGGCTEKATELNTHALTIIADQTEPFYKHITPREIQARSILGKDSLNGEYLRYTTITERAFNPIKEVFIEAIPNKWFSHELERRKELQTYIKEMEEVFITSAVSPVKEIGSEVYVPIARELITLSKRPEHIKNLIVISDLMEHTESLSFYEPKTFKKLKESPQEVESQLQSFVPLSDLTGITVYFVFNPPDIQRSEQFAITSKLYKHMLEAKGAKVYVSATLPGNIVNR